MALALRNTSAFKLINARPFSSLFERTNGPSITVNTGWTAKEQLHRSLRNFTGAKAKKQKSQAISSAVLIRRVSCPGIVRGQDGPSVNPCKEPIAPAQTVSFHNKSQVLETKTSSTDNNQNCQNVKSDLAQHFTRYFPPNDCYWKQPMQEHFYKVAASACPVPSWSSPMGGYCCGCGCGYDYTGVCGCPGGYPCAGMCPGVCPDICAGTCNCPGFCPGKCASVCGCPGVCPGVCSGVCPGACPGDCPGACPFTCPSACTFGCGSLCPMGCCNGCGVQNPPYFSPPPPRCYRVLTGYYYYPCYCYMPSN